MKIVHDHERPIGSPLLRADKVYTLWGMRNTDTSNEVYSDLKEQLRLGRLRPGERVREARVAREMEVSRTPVREAVRRLTSEGLLENEFNQAARVSRIEAEELAQLYDLRILLEGYAAEQAGRHRRERELREMRRAVERFHEAARMVRDQSLHHPAPEVYERQEQIEDRFHTCLHRMTHNRWLEEMLKSARLRSLVFGRLRGYDQKRPLLSILSRTYWHHHQIYAAIRDERAADARALLERHLRQSRREAVRQMDAEK